MSHAHPKSKEYVNSDDESGSGSGSGSDSDDIDRVERAPPPPRPSKNAAESYPKFQPAKGLYPATISAEYSSPFELDSIASKPGVELWAIRIPKDLKLSRLSGLDVDLSTGSGTLKTSSSSFKLREAGPSKPKRAVVNDEGRNPKAGPGMIDVMIGENQELSADGGQEMAGLRLLVPSKKTGKLSTAPIPISRRFVLTAVEEQQMAPDDDDLAPFLSATSNSTAGRPKRKQPSQLLAFRNRAYGADTPGPKRSKTTT